MTVATTTVAGPDLVHYLPIGTTAIAIAFLVALIYRASKRNWAPHLVWWAIGVTAYGLGTAFESSITLFGNSPELTRWWYWAGAILGGYPLATGSVYLLHKRRTANILTGLSLIVVLVATVGIFMSPLKLELLEPQRPSGAVVAWTWVRLTTPFINTYAAVFLIGGAIWSSAKFIQSGTHPRRAVGTAMIALGALLPGIGGSMAKAGIVEALYIGEFFGLILIWIGYEFCIRGPKPAPTAE
jgi:hypothetical protein